MADKQVKPMHTKLIELTDTSKTKYKFKRRAVAVNDSMLLPWQHKIYAEFLCYLPVAGLHFMFYTFYFTYRLGYG